jgi:hypothetical protein
MSSNTCTNPIYPNILWMFVSRRFYFHRQKVHACVHPLEFSELNNNRCTLWTNESLGTPEDVPDRLLEPTSDARL